MYTLKSKAYTSKCNFMRPNSTGYFAILQLDVLLTVNGFFLSQFASFVRCDKYNLTYPNELLELMEIGRDFYYLFHIVLHSIEYISYDS